MKTEINTRHVQCIVCSNDLIGRQRKYCSNKCQSTDHNRNNWKKYHDAKRIALGLPLNVGSGGNQRREKNHRWKNGTGIFQDLAYEHYEKKCSLCNSEHNLHVHHKDHNRENNTVENLQILCAKCHRKHHENRCPKTGRFLKQETTSRRRYIKG